MTDDADTPEGPAPDRYVSFAGIDCDSLSQRLVQAILRHIDKPENCNKLWDAFKAQLADADKGIAGKPDSLYLVCARVYMIEELFERCGDEEGMALLRHVEETCC